MAQHLQLEASTALNKRKDVNDRQGQQEPNRQRKSKIQHLGSASERGSYYGITSNQPSRLKRLLDAARLSDASAEAHGPKLARYGMHPFHHSQRDATPPAVPRACRRGWLAGACRGLQINLHSLQGLRYLANHVATQPPFRGYWALNQVLTMPEPTSLGENNAATFWRVWTSPLRKTALSSTSRSESSVRLPVSPFLDPLMSRNPRRA
jgi:hypothetical protein